MRVLITGLDGYLGWSLALHLARRGHVTAGADGFFRRKWVREMGSDSMIPISPMKERLSACTKYYRGGVSFYEGNLCEYPFIEKIFSEFKPEAIVHLGEMPSAPYSMIDVHHAVFSQTNNITSTLNILFAMRDICPSSHLIKLGTMGEYGTPNIDIPEGFFDIEYRGRKDTLPFPRQAGSWYHWSKVHDSYNVMFACKIWDLCSTDVMQGVVFGTSTEDMQSDKQLATRFDIDQSFGTVINRFCAQAVINEPLTPFGRGLQKRGFLPLRDSMQCLTLAIENPPSKGEYRVFNQFEKVYSVTELAEKVQKAAGKIGLSVDIENLENPRKEMEEHYYNPDHRHLLDLGYKPTHDIDAEIVTMLNELKKYKERIGTYRDILIPDIHWDGTRHRSSFLMK